MTRKRKRTPIGAIFGACPLHGHIGLLAALLLMPALTLAEVATFSTASPYQNDQNITETLSIPGASALVVSVSGETEACCDFLEILDSTGHPYDPANKFSGTIDEQFTVAGEAIQVHFTSDGSGTENGVTVTVSDKPMLLTISKQTLEDNNVAFAATDFNDHFLSQVGQTLQQIQVTTLPAQGTLSVGTSEVAVNQEISAGELDTLTYTPNAGYFGDDSFQFNGTDGTQYADSESTVNIKVFENGKTTFSTANPYDNNPEVLDILSIPDATALVVRVSGETEDCCEFVEILDRTGNPYGPAKKFSGTIDELFLVNGAAIQVHFSSDNGETGSGVTVTISDNKPMLNAVNKNAFKDESLAFSATDFNDHFLSPVGQTLQQIQVTALPAHGTLSVGTFDVAVNQEISAGELDTLTYTPNAGYFGDDRFQFNGTDGTHYTNSKAFVNLKVWERKTTLSTANPYDNNPEVLDILSIRDATALVVRVSGETQADFDLEILDSTGNPYDPPNKWSGTIDELFTVNGEAIQVLYFSYGLTTQSGVTVTVYDANTLTFYNTPTTRIRNNEAYRFTPLVYGGDGSPLTFSITNRPTWANFDTSTGTLTGTPSTSDIGTTNGIEITVSDGLATATLATFDLTVIENTPPILTGSPITKAKVGWTYNFTPTANDTNGDTLTFSITNKPDWAYFDPSTGTLSGTPTAEGTTNNIEITVSDGLATATLAAFNLTVINVTLPYVSNTVEVGRSPSAVAFNHQTDQIYVVNRDSDNVTVIDGNNNHQTTTVSVGNYPKALAINPQTNQIYVANLASNNVTVIDGNNHHETTTVAVGEMPIALAINPRTNQIYVANAASNNVTVIDGNNNHQTTTVNVGYLPTALAINPRTNQIYVANDSNNVLVIDGNNNLETVNVGNEPTALAINPQTNQIYVANKSSNNVTVIDGNNNHQTTTVNVGYSPRALAINPRTNQIYVANLDSNNVLVIDGNNNHQTTTVNVGKWPLPLAINPLTNQIYVANLLSNNVTVIDGNNNHETTTIDVGYFPRALAINSPTNQIYVANRGSNNVTVINGDTNNNTQ